MLNTWALNTCLLNGQLDGGGPEVPQAPNIELQPLKALLVLGAPTLVGVVGRNAIDRLQAQVRSPVHTLVPAAQMQGLAAMATVGQPRVQGLGALRGLHAKPVFGKPRLRAQASATALLVTLRLGALNALMPEVHMRGLQVAIGQGEPCLRSMIQQPPLFVRAKLHGPTLKNEVTTCPL